MNILEMLFDYNGDFFTFNEPQSTRNHPECVRDAISFYVAKK
jgi:hypothetical protein